MAPDEVTGRPVGTKRSNSTSSPSTLYMENTITSEDDGNYLLKSSADPEKGGKDGNDSMSDGDSSSSGDFKSNVRSTLTTMEQGCGRYWSDVCSINFIKKKLPILQWAPKYSLSDLNHDVIAGLTVGLTVIPQGLAYSALAGLDLQYGLYSAFMGSFIYFFMGTSKDITLGPTAIMSILVSEYALNPWQHDSAEHSTSPELAVLLCFLCGCIQLLMSLFKLGFLVRYISHAVLVGFVSAASIVISCTQIRKIFGIKTPRGVFQTLYGIITHLGEINWYDFALGVTCMIILYVLKWAKGKYGNQKKKDSQTRKFFRTLIWFVGTARNIFVVVGASIIAYAVTDMSLPVEERPITLTKQITPGLPPVAVPRFSISYPVDGGNTTGNATMATADFGELIGHLGSGLIVIPLVGFLESIAIAKSFGRKHNYKVDSEQELLAGGVANVISSFFSSYPITGSFGRSAVNAQSNVATPAGGLLTGAVVLLALQFLTVAFQFIPAPALGAVIIMAVINLFDWEGIKHVWIINKLDFISLMVTFFLCFWDIAYGIMAGIAVSIIILLMNHARPKARVQYIGTNLIVRLHRGLDFPGSEFVEDKLVEIAEENNSLQVIIFDGDNITNLDYSAAECFKHAATALKRRDVQLKICGLRDHHKRILERTSIRSVGVEFFDSVQAAIEDSRRIQEMVALNQRNITYPDDGNDDDLHVDVTVHNHYKVEEIPNRPTTLPNHT